MKKKLVLSMVALLLTLSTLVTASFAYWDMLTVKSTPSITLGEGTQLTLVQTLNGATGEQLIPAGVLQDTSNEVYEITFDYKVDLNKDFINAVNVNMQISDIKNSEGVDVSAWVKIEIVGKTAEEVVTGTVNGLYSAPINKVLNVVVKITLVENAESVDYSGIQGKIITFDVTFTATQ